MSGIISNSEIQTKMKGIDLNVKIEDKVPMLIESDP
jgi:hypothetical protein